MVRSVLWLRVRMVARVGAGGRARVGGLGNMVWVRVVSGSLVQMLVRGTKRGRVVLRRRSRPGMRIIDGHVRRRRVAI